MAGSAAVALCLGLVAACGSGGEDGGYVNDGAAGPDKGAPTAPVPPEDKVSLHPLQKRSPSASPSPDGETNEGDEERGDGSESPSPGGQAGGNGGSDSPSSGPDGGSGGSSEAPAPSEPGGSAKLSVGDHKRAAADERHCERVTFDVRNTGGSPVTSGTVSFATHVIGLLGTDLGAVETSQELRAPIAAGERGAQSYTVCLDSWRVPLGMSVETREVDVSWK